MKLVFAFENIGVQQHQAIVFSEQLAHQRMKRRVDFHAQDSSGMANKSGCQAASAAANFDGEIVGRQLSAALDQVNEVEVNEETLAELVLGLNAALAEEVLQIGQGLSRS